MSRKILIADDDPGIVDVTKIILEQAGFEVLTAPNVSTTISLLKKHRPNLLLLDIWLAGENGAHLAIAQKKDQETKKIPIILVSANNDVEKMARETGADDFIAKPFDIDHLEQMVYKHIGRK